MEDILIDGERVHVFPSGAGEGTRAKLCHGWKRTWTVGDMQTGKMLARRREVCDFGGCETKMGWMERTAWRCAVGGGGWSRVQVPQERWRKGL